MAKANETIEINLQEPLVKSNSYLIVIAVSLIIIVGVIAVIDRIGTSITCCNKRIKTKRSFSNGKHEVLNRFTFFISIVVAKIEHLFGTR